MGTGERDEKDQDKVQDKLDSKVKHPKPQSMG